MKITGSGIDIVNTGRFDDAGAAERLARRVLTESEFEYCFGKSNFILHMSGRIAAKEALFKALSPAVRLSWKDIEITSGGNPVLSENCRAYKYLRENSLLCSISISHDTGYAAAHAIVWSAL